MARRSKATAEKRRKEVARLEKQRAKAERRAQRKLGLGLPDADADALIIEPAAAEPVVQEVVERPNP